MDNDLRETFLFECRRIAKYWALVGDSKHDAAKGTVFDMLVMLDGMSATMPPFEMSDIDNGNMLHDDFYIEKE